MRLRICLLVVLIVAVGIAPAMCEQKAVGLELSVGGLVHPHVLGGTDEFGDNLFFGTVSAGVNVPISRWLDLGAWVGYFHNSPYLPEARMDEVWPLAFPVTYGVKAVVGDRKNGFGFAVNFGVTPSLGLYFRNWFVNGMVGLITTEYQGRWLIGEEPTISEISTRVYPYIEVGYCLEL